MDLMFDKIYCECMITAPGNYLQVTIEVQRLNIDVVLNLVMGLTKYFDFIYLILCRLLCEFCLFCSANASTAIVSANINSILILNGTNFKDWKENVLIVLDCMDLDLALRSEQPPLLTTDGFTKAKKEFER